MSVKEVYEKVLSVEILKTIRYSIVEKLIDGFVHYGIKISSVVGDSDEREDTAVELISRDKEIVEKLIEYLYENSVDTIHFKDVVEDYIFKLNNK